MLILPGIWLREIWFTTEDQKTNMNWKRLDCPFTHWLYASAYDLTARIILGSVSKCRECKKKNQIWCCCSILWNNSCTCWLWCWRYLRTDFNTHCRNYSQRFTGMTERSWRNNGLEQEISNLLHRSRCLKAQHRYSKMLQYWRRTRSTLSLVQDWHFETAIEEFFIFCCFHVEYQAHVSMYVRLLVLMSFQRFSNQLWSSKSWEFSISFDGPTV